MIIYQYFLRLKYEWGHKVTVLDLFLHSAMNFDVHEHFSSSKYFYDVRFKASPE